MCDLTGALRLKQPTASHHLRLLKQSGVVEDEILTALRARSPLDLATLAGAVKISPESALYFVGTLLREGKATISPRWSTGTTDETA